MSKISVIITAYNVEKYIYDAVKSAMLQTLKDIEILAVDDCSTDRTQEILSALAEQDSRVRVIRHTQNRGVMLARKIGVEQASGEYIMFLDGDDLLCENACEAAYRAICEEDVELLQFDTDILAEGEWSEAKDYDFRKYLKSPAQKILTDSPCGLLDHTLTAKPINFTVWNKIYRAELLKKANSLLPDEHLNIAEDVLLSFLIQHTAHSYAYLAQKLYIYRFGCGISTRARAREAQISAWAKCTYVSDYLETFARDQGTESLCKQTLKRIKKQMLGNLTEFLLHRVAPEQKQYFIDEARKHCSDEDLILSIADYTYRSSEFIEDRVARECAPLEMFRTTKKAVKTIGVYYFRIYNGGVENVISSLSDIWVKHGYEVVLFTDEKPNRDDYPLPASVRRVTVPAMKQGGFTALQTRIREFRRAILESGIDIMVYNAWINPYLLLDEMIIKSCGVALTIHTHNLFCCDAIAYDVPAAIRNTALGSLYEFADSVITLTDVDTAWWQAMGLRVIKTVNPIQLPLSVERSLLGGHELLLVCRISPEKQVIDAIKVAELVRQRIPDVRLTVVGKGDYLPYVEQVEHYVKDNGLDEFVKLVGFESNVLPYYQRSDILLSTSRFEGFGLALMESKICGLPMVLYELANLDICKENRGTVIVPQGDINAAADAVVRILSDDTLKKRLGDEARASAEQTCGIDLAALWNRIFAQTMQPKEQATPLFQKMPLEIAVNLAAEYHAQGIEKRKYIDSDERLRQCEEQCRALSEVLEGISKSESYRFGLLITAIPRKLRNLFKRRKK